jgi:hypothetical protein
VLNLRTSPSCGFSVLDLAAPFQFSRVCIEARPASSPVESRAVNTRRRFSLQGLGFRAASLPLVPSLSSEAQHRSESGAAAEWLEFVLPFSLPLIDFAHRFPRRRLTAQFSRLLELRVYFSVAPPQFRLLHRANPCFGRRSVPPAS